MHYDWMERPIPPPPPEGPQVTPQECGEPAIDATGLHPRLQFLASYRAQGIAVSPRRLWLRRSVAQRLCQAADALEDGMSLAVFDGLRPAPVQQALFDSYRARLAADHTDWPPQRLWMETCRFVAAPQTDPKHPSSHLTGGAVDLTLYRDGHPLAMGTDFDDFRPQAATRYYEQPGLSGEQRRWRNNRRLLYHLMAAQGFTNYEEEWWHFDFGNPSWARLTGQPACYGACPVPVAEWAP